eukprot:TRINITY_DN27135_c0_g1_i1.p1 TRINITY_DN27135_c0_g1~~TRINITY_DN27135_c0_g1_i1.p1  ORF type:complete len:126 (+),score=7.41 TRINITY_DN27135_c0_g1_i1:150-527(+)
MVAPVPQDVPMPCFAAMVPTKTDTSMFWVRDQYRARPGEVQTFLKEVASLLLSVPGQSLPLSVLGSILPVQFRRWLKGRKLILMKLLSCFDNDFFVMDGGRHHSVTYLHPNVKSNFDFMPQGTAA